jgi:predicted transcriptional regulator of viral defense system
MSQSPPQRPKLDLRSDEALDQLQAQARYYFQPAEFAELTGRAPHSPSLGMALHRLAKRRRIVTVTRRPSGYLIVPPEHASFGAPPFTWWIDDCLKPIEPLYYVALLSAAQHWGSAHYARQDVQVMISRAHLPLTPGRLKVTFVAKANLHATPTVTVRTGVAPWRVSTRAATALDLLRHQDWVGGLESVARILKDIGSVIEAAELRDALNALDQVSTAQRLGFLLERLKLKELADSVSKWLGSRAHARAPQALELGTPLPSNLKTDPHWRVTFDPWRLSQALEIR